MSMWHSACSRISGARDTGDDNITSCSRFYGYCGEDSNRKQGDAVIPRCVAYFFAILFLLGLSPGTACSLTVSLTHPDLAIFSTFLSIREA